MLAMLLGVMLMGVETGLAQDITVGQPNNPIPDPQDTAPYAVIDEYSVGFENLEDIITVRGWNVDTGYSVIMKPASYDRQPDYWIIKVKIRRFPGPAAQVLTPFEVKLNIDAYRPPFPPHILQKMKDNPRFRPVRPTARPVRGRKGIELHFMRAIKSADGLWIGKLERVRIEFAR